MNLPHRTVFIFAAFALAAAPFTGCQKVDPVAETQNIPEPERAPVIATATAQAAPPVSMPPPPSPEPNYLAPEGVYFLLVATSVETEDGIFGLKPGTQVLKQPNGKFAAGELQVDLREDQVTNDLRLAGRIANADASAQAAIRSAAQAGALAERNRQAATIMAAPVVSKPSPRSSAGSAGSPPAAFSETSTALSKGGLGGSHSQTKDTKRMHRGTDGNWRYD